MTLTRLPDSVRFHILWNGLREALDGAESVAIWFRLSIALDSYSEKTQEFTEEGGSSLICRWTLLQDVATDSTAVRLGVRKASRSHASDAPAPGEYRDV